MVRRVPGISIIDDKFVMVRGLSQRYNNVWINGAAVPSSEADSRAFSFDVIPSSQVDNLQIIKSPAPQYPADFTGGFILIDTKEVPGKNSAHVSVGASVNDRTHFSDFLAGKGGGTDFLGFDNFRSLHGGIHGNLKPAAGGQGISLLGNHFNNDWRVRTKHPIPDISLAADMNRSREFDNGARLSMLGALSYSNAYRTYSPMTNSLFGAYDITHDESVYLRRSTDHQYSNNVKLGALFNISFNPAKGSGRYEWKNIFNQLGTDRYTSREDSMPRAMPFAKPNTTTLREPLTIRSSPVNTCSINRDSTGMLVMPMLIATCPTVAVIRSTISLTPTVSV